MLPNELLDTYSRDLKTIELSKLLQTENEVSLGGLCGNLKVIIPLSISYLKENNHCFICADKKEAMLYYSNLCNYLNNEKVFFFPYSNRKPYDDELINNANVIMRTETIQHLKENKNEKTYVVTYPEGLVELYPDKKTSDRLSYNIGLNEKINQKSILDNLNAQYFTRVDFVKNPGEYALRGNILDVFSFTNIHPFRIESDDDFIAKIKEFDVDTQLTIKELENIKLLSNIQKDKNNKAFASLFDFMGEKWTFWVDNLSLSANIIDQKFLEAVDIFNEMKKKSKIILPHEPKVIFTDKKSFLNKIKDRKVVHLNNKKTKLNLNFNSKPPKNFNKNLPLLEKEIKEYNLTGYSVKISFQSDEQILKLKSYFESIGSLVEYKPYVSKVSEGFVDLENKRVVFTDHEIFNRYFRYAHQKKIVKKQKNYIKKSSELSVGDYVVHIDHGVGRFVGLEKIISQGIEREVLRLVYKNNDVVYTDINSLHKISKYTGSSQTPNLNSLSNLEWEKKKKKIKKRLVEIADDLIKLYLERRDTQGFAFERDNYLQIELESSFIYQDTPDQIKTTEEVKKDMESRYPMDRLVCGDVGFGKTEIAVRAAFKAVCSNKQVLIIVPTTILAFQHYKTFTKRLERFPVNIDYVSRFRKNKEKEGIINKIKKGDIDILIGTHTALNDKYEFKDLGLLVIDEEQKFGVALKEKIKKKKTNLDCLTLTATPIPRTLHFSLIGVRDISIIKTAPKNRQSVHTELSHFDEKKVRDIIKSELMRFGQVFFVHNRVENIYEIANIINRLLPDSKVAVAHGQQKGDQLEKTMLKFIEGQYDILVSTNIIESGLDIPNANTIIINQAHMFGLSDLHQMRGRVGRSNKKAFCYLLTPKTSLLTNDARKRLIVLEEFSGLGDGLDIALKDLDIRGAGNLLGGEQSGFINELGFDTYNKILDEALGEVEENEKGFERNNIKKIKPNMNCLVDPHEKTIIPKDYIQNSDERLKTYGLIEEKSKDGLFKEIEENLKDRFGPIPNEVNNLLKCMRVKWLGAKCGIDKITIKEDVLRFVFFKSKSEDVKTRTFKNIVDVFENMKNKYSVVDRNNQIIIRLFGDLNLEKTLKILKKTSN